MSSCVLVVADPERIAELVAALSAPLSSTHAPGLCDLLVSSGGDDTIDLFRARRPEVVVVTATLVTGDSRSLIEALRGAGPRGEVAIVVVGDDADSGPIRTAIDAMDLEPDRFVSRPLSDKALRFAVATGVDAVAVVRGAAVPVPARQPTTIGLGVATSRAAAEGAADDDPGDPTRAVLRARWEALADSIGGVEDSIGPHAGDAPPLVPFIIHPRSARPPVDEVTPPPSSWRPEPAAVGSGSDWHAVEPSAPTREPTLIIRDEVSSPPAAPIATPLELSRPGIAVVADSEPSPSPSPDHDESTSPTIERPRPPTDQPPLRLAELDPNTASAATSANTPPPLPPPGTGTEAVDPDTLTSPRISIKPIFRSRIPSEPPAERPAPPPTAPSRSTTEEIWPMTRPPAAATPVTDVEDLAAAASDPDATADHDPAVLVARTNTIELSSMLSAEDRARYLAEVMPHDSVVVAERGPDESWSTPILLAELPDRDSRRDLQAQAQAARARADSIDELGLDDFDDDDVDVDEVADGLLEDDDDDPAGLAGLTAPPRSRSHVTAPDADFISQPRAKTVVPVLPERPVDERPGGRDFARQLRAKMSQMAQRLFQGADAAPARADDHAPRHDHHTEIDLASLGNEVPLGGGVTEIEARHAPRLVEAPPATSPGSWDTHVRERGLADQGDLVRGTVDAALLLARMFTHASTGRVAFRRTDFDVEKVVFFDQGRPVFASSNEPGDRMGQLLVREGKITAAQYERCQVHVAESGRRMGEILVDFGYLKRRELLPAVRRHVEDIIYSLFGWSSGRYHVVIDPTPCAERIRLSRHPASLILEGIRRKLDRTTLDRLVGPPSTVIEVPDRDKLGGIVNLADLAAEERAALVAFDGQADLAQVARVAMIDVADVLPFAWGLCVLGLATARRTDAEVVEESTALVGETDLAIDRERVRARWQLVTEADYFALLGVRRDATTFEIRRAYQSARRDYAADCFPQDLRRELAQELEDIAHVLDEAFRVLRDDRLRGTYLSNLVE